jgi:AraC-like DNA-binding protein
MDLLQEMDGLIARHAPPELGPSAVPGLTLYRSDEETSLIAVAYRPMLCVLTSGVKQTLLGERAYTCRAGEFLVVSAALPVSGRVVTAPYRALSVDLDPAVISRLTLEMDVQSGPVLPPPAGLLVTRMDTDLLEPLTRLARLVERPGDIAMMAPMIERELIWRLLSGDHAATLRQIASPESRLTGVARAIRWIRDNYAQPMRIEGLSDMAGMSLSTFHRHFRTVTTMSPLQFQKQVRLQEARAYMLSDGGGAAEAGFAVGYDSASQFSREYARAFGAPPARDAARMRRTMGAA